MVGVWLKPPDTAISHGREEQTRIGPHKLAWLYRQRPRNQPISIGLKASQCLGLDERNKQAVVDHPNKITGE